jgi:hypothetical protein
MASSSKKRTTMAKLNRETAVRDRRARKQAKKDARKQAAAGSSGSSETPTGGDHSPRHLEAPVIALNVDQPTVLRADLDSTS